jgi:hypothetical protein
MVAPADRVFGPQSCLGPRLEPGATDGEELTTFDVRSLEVEGRSELARIYYCLRS